MGWTRSEQAAGLLVACAAISGSIALLALRRPAPPVQLIERAQDAEIVVQVDGEVAQPGIYHLPAGTRAGDAVRAAGGPTPVADLVALNLARLLRDGDRLTVPARATRPDAQAGRRVSVNTAAEAELESLPGIGPVLARRIVAHRRHHGAFARLQDLLQVEGVGPKLLERLRPLIVVE